MLMSEKPKYNSVVTNSAEREVYVAFNYQLPESKPVGVIFISDMAGKEIQRFAVSGKQGQQVWDIRTIKSGVYLYTLTSGGLQKTGKVVIN